MASAGVRERWGEVAVEKIHEGIKEIGEQNRDGQDE